MKIILNKIYFHPVFLITVLIGILIGKFRLISYFMLLIIVHEIGHIFVSLIFKWNIERIIVLPFGCLIKYRELINRPLFQEFLISISGITFQMLFYILINRYVNYNYFDSINKFIVFFNLLPIYPLDGSKILNVIFNIITSFKSSITLTLIFSYIFLILLFMFFINNNKLIIIVISFLVKEVNKLYKERNMIFNKFLLERYLNNYNFKKKKTIDNVISMKKDYKHLFYIDNKYLTENYFLQKMFDINSKV